MQRKSRKSTKVTRRVLLGLTQEADDELRRTTAETHLDETAAINLAITGKIRFSPLIEDMIAEVQQRRDLSRGRAIELLLGEAQLLRVREDAKKQNPPKGGAQNPQG